MTPLGTPLGLPLIGSFDPAAALIAAAAGVALVSFHANAILVVLGALVAGLAISSL
jgi:hypothetical protein